CGAMTLSYPPGSMAPLAALGLGVPAILLEREDFRVNSAQAKLADILPLMRPGEAFSFARALTVPSLSVWRQKIKVRRQEVLAAYAGLVGPYVRSLSLARRHAGEHSRSVLRSGL